MVGVILFADPDEVRDCFERFAGLPGRVSVGSLPRARFEHFETTSAGFDRATDFVIARDREQVAGVYVRMSTVREDLERGRGTGADSVAYPALLLDLDLHDPQRHKGSHNLPPSSDAALQAFEDVRLPEPTLWISSGAGLYPEWRFEDHLERDEGAELLARLHRAVAARWPWHVDSTGDAARILRVPGSVNRKVPDDPLPCRVLPGGSGRLWSKAELVEAIDALEPVLDEAPTSPRRSSAKRAPRSAARRKFGPFAQLSECIRSGDVPWSSIFEPAGWTFVREEVVDGFVVELWRRPGGATSDYSARVGLGGEGVGVVWSDATELPSGPGQGLSAGRIFAGLHHHGDERAATADLYRAARRENGATAAAQGLPRAFLDLIDDRRPAPGRDGQEGATVTTPDDTTPDLGRRLVRLESAAGIRPKRSRWTWDRRIPRGELSLIGGREGIGKSTVAYTLIAELTRGRLDGEYKGQPRNVAIAATEDSWEHTIVPRLMAADADLEKVFRVEVTSAGGVETTLLLPRDIDETKQALIDYDVALLLLDPLMSRLDGALDTHKDGEVRQALEPLVQVAQQTGAAVVGLIHVNKGRTNDPLTSLMGSRAFAAVARSVLFVMTDPDDDTVRLLGLAKSNLGPTDLPTLTFTITSKWVADTDDGPVYSGAVAWGEARSESIRDALESSSETVEARTVVSEASEWLRGFLEDNGGTEATTAIFAEGAKEKHSREALKRARTKLKIKSENVPGVFPKRTVWTLPGASAVGVQSGHGPGENTPTEPTALTEHSRVSRRSGVSRGVPRANLSRQGTCQRCETEDVPLVHGRCVRCAYPDAADRPGVEAS